MSNPDNHTKIVSIPYPGRDLAIVAVLFSVLVPLIGALIGFIAAKMSIGESLKRGYSQIGIQRFAYGLSSVLLVLQLLMVLLMILVGSGTLAPPWFPAVQFTSQ